ncbi:MAG: hypothetical protein ACYC3H_01590 [Bellilinea sp.]
MKTLFTSRKFWMTMLALIAVVISTFVPSFSLDQERGAGLVVIVAAYVLGVAVDPGPGGWSGVFKSRKFWAALVGLVVIFLDGFGVKLPFGLTEAHLAEIATALGIFIAGVALEGKVPRFNPTR